VTAILPPPARERPRAAREAALAWASRGRRRFLDQLRTFVGFPSISGNPRHAGDIAACGRWLAAELRGIGLEDVRTDGDIVWGAWRHAPGRPTLLVYGHYDVVDVEPPAAWRSPPFQPVVRDGRLHGRGASDDKGQLFAHVKALEAYLRGPGRLPVNVLCLFEGAEEIGSPGLATFLPARRTALRCDAAVVSDTRMLGPRQPALTYGLRGSLAIELGVTTGRRPVHSGQLGGAVLSAGQALAELIATLHHEDGRVAVPGFYARVRRRRSRSARPAADEAALRRSGAHRLWGDERFSVEERTTVRPALVVTELRTGGTGHAVIPVSAAAQVNVRLVPDQDPLEVEQAIRRHVDAAVPAAARVDVRRRSASPPVLVDTRHPAFAAAARACRRGFGAPPALVRSGGSIPAVAMLQRALGVPVVLMGFALPQDAAHGANESFALSSFFGGIATSIHFLAELGGA
jgi:acetylornithine deacetylase/succinyl-diaminopimelate desuccinylase-like protein